MEMHAKDMISVLPSYHLHWQVNPFNRQADFKSHLSDLTF